MNAHPQSGRKVSSCAGAAVPHVRQRDRLPRLLRGRDGAHRGAPGSRLRDRSAGGQHVRRRHLGERTPREDDRNGEHCGFRGAPPTSARPPPLSPCPPFLSFPPPQPVSPSRACV